jgi:hypothetical protein
MKTSNPLGAGPSTPSISRDQTVKTPRSSSAGAPGVKADQGPFPKTAPLPTSMVVMPPPLKPIKPVVPTEADQTHALVLKVAAEVLEERGLCKRERVLAADGSGRVTAIRLVFDPAIWTEQLELL